MDDTRGIGGRIGSGEYTRFRRRLFVYRCTLVNAGFPPPKVRPNVGGLFGEDIRKVMANAEKISQFVPQLNDANGVMEWDVAGNFVRAFAQWSTTKEFQDFDRNTL